VIDKQKTKLLPSDYLTSAVTKLYQAYDEFLIGHKEKRILFFDRANEKHINTHGRKSHAICFKSKFADDDAVIRI